MGYDNISTHYYYDSDSQLTRVDSDLNEPYTETFSYDTRGNIISRKVYDYTRNETITSSPTETTTFTYANSGWKDLLVSVNGTELTYDANGNVLTYGDKEYTWNTGRNLESIVDGDDEFSYTYDENGIRTSKTVNGSTTYYNTRNGVILSQTDGTNTMYFEYDTNGTPLGFIYNGMQYFYMTNQMGDVIAITDTSGTIVGNYEYDAWGKVLTADTSIAQQNPFRYRGYYYDNETGYYYLQSRYYDAEICRFINSDIAEISQMSKDIPVGTNLFAYCCNEPINNVDANGFWKKDIHYGRAKNEGEYGYYDGTYEWLIEKNIDPTAAEIIAAADMQMDCDTDTSPLPNKKAINLYVRQRYHFDRYDGVADTRVYYGSLFFSEALNTYNNATTTYVKRSKELKNTYTTSSSKYNIELKKEQKKRDTRIADALVYLGAALHCYQDVYSHGNITEGHKNYTKIIGHSFKTKVDNPYYKWTNSKKLSVTENVKGPRRNRSLSPRYYDTRKKTMELIIAFKNKLNYSNYIFVDVNGYKIQRSNINNKYFIGPDIKVDFIKGKELK